MTFLETTIQGLIAADADLDHFVCCRDKHMTYCGKYDDSEWKDFDHASCEECEELNKNENFCPIRPICIGPPLMTRYCREHE